MQPAAYAQQSCIGRLRTRVARPPQQPKVDLMTRSAPREARPWAASSASAAVGGL